MKVQRPQPTHIAPHAKYIKILTHISQASFLWDVGKTVQIQIRRHKTRCRIRFSTDVSFKIWIKMENTIQQP